MSISIKSYNSRKSINIILFSAFNLVREVLKFSFENNSEIKVQEFASNPNKLLQKVSKINPDVVLFCPSNTKMDQFEIIPKIFEVSSQSKVVILAALNGELDQTKVLKLGATGIVGTNQRIEVLIRTIRQVADGEVCLNQQLIATLLANGNKNGNRSNGKNGHYGVYENDSLTNRELEVVRIIARGLTNKEISKELFISEATVRHHLSSIYSKLYVEDRLNLIIYAYQNKIVKRHRDNVWI